jgi:LEA14-like dessication related protein
MSHKSNSHRYRIVGAFATVLLLVAGCATLSGTTEAPYLSLVSIEPAELTPFEQKYRLAVRVQNPNAHALDISGLSYVLDINGQALLKGVSDEPASIPAYGESTLQLSGVSTLFGLMRQLRALQEGKDASINYKLHGKLSLGNSIRALPFSYEGTLLPPAQEGGGATGSRI